MKFPTKDELELLNPPLRDYWKAAINKYWLERYREYEREQKEIDPTFGIARVKIRYNNLDY